MSALPQFVAIPVCIEGRALPQPDRVRLDEWFSRPAATQNKVVGFRPGAHCFGDKLMPSKALAVHGSVCFVIQVEGVARGGVVVTPSQKGNAYVQCISMDPRLEPGISLAPMRSIFRAILDRWGSAVFIADTKMARKWQTVLRRWGFAVYAIGRNSTTEVTVTLRPASAAA